MKMSTNINDDGKDQNSGTPPSETERDAIAYCGLHCADCFGSSGRIAALAKELRKELRAVKFDKLVDGIPFKELRDYESWYAALGGLMRLKCPSMCRGGGGNPFCKIRKCAQARSLRGCWECDAVDDCPTLATLEAGHGSAHYKNLRTLKKKGEHGFLSGKRYWYAKPEN